MLTLRLLGPVEIRAGGRRLVAAGRDKGLTALAYLAAEGGRAHTREDLADLFWPDMVRERALQNLRQTLLRLRQLLTVDARGACALAADRHSIAFDVRAEHWIDLAGFTGPGVTAESTDRMAQRAALYRGDFMADVTVTVGERFEAWVRERRARYRVKALALESALVTVHEQAGHLERAVAHAQRCVELEPWDEANRQRLIRLLALAGQPQAALGEFDAWRAALRRELGADVQCETLALTQAIRSGGLAPPDVSRVKQPVERRQVTVLECGLDCGDEDPEILDAALAGPLGLARGILERHGAHVADARHGRLIAYFGWPSANEHAAAHAARAALALRSELPAAHRQVRVAAGIDCGPMLIGDGVDDAGAWMTVERAMRLRLAASAGAVLVSRAIGQVLGERFHLRAQRNAMRLTGEREPPARDGPETLPLTGRAADLALLARYWREAPAGDRRVVALTGQAGIGKSRLAREFLRIRGLGGSRVRWCECEPLHADSPLCALVEMLRGALALSERHALAQVRDRIAAMLPGDRGVAARLLAPIFFRGDGGSGANLQAGARAALVNAVVRLVGSVLAAGGTEGVLVVDDAHWADATTIEVIDALGRGALPRGCAVLLLARELPGGVRAREIALAPLEPMAAIDLAKIATGTQSVDPGAVQSGEGIPLFIIELARMRRIAGDAAGAVPATLRDLLSARLDQAGGDKELLQTAAVLGRRFDIADLRDLADASNEPIEAALVRLAGLGLIERAAGSASFTHALVRRAAYDSLPRARRIALHQRRAEQLQAGVQGASPDAPEAIAWHLGAGGLEGQAAVWWLRAAQRASRRPAYAEAARFAERALAAVEAAGRSEDRSETELAALMAGAHARVALGGYFDPSAQALFERARSMLHVATADSRKRFGTLRGHWLGASSRTSHREARRIAEEMAGLAKASSSPLLQGIAHYLIGNSTLWLGEFTAALEHLEAAVEILRRARPGSEELLAHDQDFEAAATGYLGWAHWHLGHPARALELGRQAMRLARERGHLPTLLHVATSYCSIALGSGAATEAMNAARETVDLADESGLAMWADIGRLQAGWAQSALGRPVDTEAIAQVLARLCTMYPGGAAGFQAIAGQIDLDQGDDARATRVLRSLRRSLEVTQAGMFTVARHVLESRLARKLGEGKRAASAARHGLMVARAQGAPALEAVAWQALRASCSRRHRCALPGRCQWLRRSAGSAQAARNAERRRPAHPNTSSSQSIETAAE